jgi:hypothetical protein
MLKFQFLINSYLQYERGRQSFRPRESRCNSSERKRRYSRVLYLVLFDTSLESESVTLAFNQKKLKVLLRNLQICLVLKWKKEST